jgi:V/A-type H+-transporting ATPase subunit F
MYRVGIIGDRDSILGFKAVGLDVFPCLDSDEAKKTLHEKAKEDYAIIFVTEGFAQDMKEAMAQYKESKLPAIVPIPGTDGSHGVGLGILKKSVERAIGVDILFGGVSK